jgi:uncharacterized protein YcbK (DUF882 family)
MKRVILIAVCLLVGVAFAARALLYSQNVQVTSWFRSPWKNREIGGTWFSLHQIGWAFDVVPQNKPLQQLMTVWPVKAVVETDHIHLQIL